MPTRPDEMRVQDAETFRGVDRVHGAIALGCETTNPTTPAPRDHRTASAAPAQGPSHRARRGPVPEVRVQKRPALLRVLVVRRRSGRPREYPGGGNANLLDRAVGTRQVSKTGTWR